MKLKPADIYFSKCIRQAAGWTCQKCGRQYEHDNGRGLDTSHHFGRARRSVRWCRENAAALCMGCHRQFHSFPLEGAAWVRELLGDELYEVLQEKANTIIKVSKLEEKEIAAHYRSEYRRMVKENDTDFQSWQ